MAIGAAIVGGLTTGAAAGAVGGPLGALTGALVGGLIGALMPAAPRATAPAAGSPPSSPGVSWRPDSAGGSSSSGGGSSGGQSNLTCIDNCGPATEYIGGIAAPCGTRSNPTPCPTDPTTAVPQINQVALQPSTTMFPGTPVAPVVAMRQNAIATQIGVQPRSIQPIANPSFPGFPQAARVVAPAVARAAGPVALARASEQRFTAPAAAAAIRPMQLSSGLRQRGSLPAQIPCGAGTGRRC